MGAFQFPSLLCICEMPSWGSCRREWACISMQQRVSTLRKESKAFLFPRIIIVTLLCVIMGSCSTAPKDNAVYDLLVLRTEISNNGYNYTQADWENAFEEYYEICQRLDEMQFTHEERLEIDKVKGEIAGVVASFAVRDISEEVQYMVDEFFSYSEGFLNSLQNNLFDNYDR